MDFEFTEDQAMLRDSLRKFVAREYTFERRQGILRSAHGCSPEVWRLLAEQGVFSLGLPEDVGGYGGPTEIMIVMEELGRGLVLEPFMSTVVLGGGLIRDHGTVEQRAQLLPQIATGECRVALAHHEAGARYVLDHVSTVARRGKAAAAGSYLLGGSKTVVLDAPLADLLIVSARDDAEGGLSLFVVEPGAVGVKSTAYRTQDGRSAADITFENVELPASARLGAPGVALSALEQSVDCALAALCAEAVGAIEAVNEGTLQYLNTRKQFGQPIGRFQVLQHRMADMFLMATQAKSMSFLATGRCREPDRSERRRALSAAKAFVGKAARFVGQQAVQLHGGMGMSAELGISHYFKRLTMINATFGDIDHHVGAFSDLLLAELS
jgi:alkylation response protein AidB-like acyl-CoA dehydrogenase